MKYSAIPRSKSSLVGLILISVTRMFAPGAQPDYRLKMALVYMPAGGDKSRVLTDST